MEIREINNKEVWESFLLGCQEKSFLDSWNWGEFQKKEGNKIWRLGIYENGRLIEVALVIKVRAKRGTFLFLPHGPVIKSRIKNQELRALVNKLKEIAKEEKASFIKIAPIWEKNDENIKIFRELGFREAPIHIHPEVTWELDISLPEEELLMGMRKTTRYLIRQGEKDKNIEIVQSQDKNDIEIFNRIYTETAKRHHFFKFSERYLQNQFDSFYEDNQISIFLGRYKNEIISAAIIVFWQDTVFYHHGASLSKYQKIPVSYLLQWEAIKEAKRRGCKKYNFWGIAPIIGNLKRHPWLGLTLFKVGFGGYRNEYVKTQDLPLSKSYWLTYFFEKLRKIKRGL